MFKKNLLHNKRKFQVLCGFDQEAVKNLVSMNKKFFLI